MFSAICINNVIRKYSIHLFVKKGRVTNLIFTYGTQSSDIATGRDDTKLKVSLVSHLVSIWIILVWSCLKNQTWKTFRNQINYQN